ncbi:MAG: glycosyltransferase family 4 protein [Acidobacteriota bacterium]|nr:glycosyltransferase family 4 protein [Acidobacteriota bacterium]
MRIAIANPTTWPYVRRGAERFINELAAYLAARGHEVTVVSGKPGRTEVIPGNGYTTVCHRRWWHPALAKAGLLEFHMFFFPCLVHLLRERFDAVVCLTFMDAFAALVSRRFTGAPCIFVVNGIPPRKPYFRSLTLKGAVFGRAIRGADAIVAISEFVRGYLEQRWGRRCERLPIPLDADQFTPRRPAPDTPEIILCAAALVDRRKGGRPLMAAFNLLKRRRPQVLLQIAYALPESLRAELLALVEEPWRKDVLFTPADRGLADLFAAATISVLPSIWEPFGMVVLESMAAGTPVAATRDGALPELVSDPNVGCLFDPGPERDAELTNIEGMARAMEDCLDLAARPETARRCREHALRYAWREIGPRYERLIQSLVDARSDTPAEVERV